MLKRCDFKARRKGGCESISLMLTGRLFQMSGPQTEKARRPNWVLVRRTTADLQFAASLIIPREVLALTTFNVRKNCKFRVTRRRWLMYWPTRLKALPSNCGRWSNWCGLSANFIACNLRWPKVMIWDELFPRNISMLNILVSGSVFMYAAANRSNFL